MTNTANQAEFVRAKLIKTEIPVLLAKLILAGKRDEALNLLIAWGTKQKDEETIWQDAKALLPQATP
ncbi:MAG TPA: hypothetical protein GXX46_05920 [Peptococcaceae bacterium]|nr:hypothetical protein [Peptococcaceae bacterium]